jgi:hypothetical protein
MQNIYSSKFEGNFLERPSGKITDEKSNKDGKSRLNMSSKKLFVPMYCEKNMLRTMSLIVKLTFICMKIVI